MNSQLNGLEFFDSQVKMPLAHLPVRSTRISLLNQRTLLVSPLPKWTHEDFRRIGPITDIFAPNLFHHLGVRGAVEAFPEAKLWGAPGLDSKRPGLTWHHILNESNWPFQEELALVLLDGAPSFNEAVLVHKRSKTLICADLCFNLTQVQGVGARIIFGLFGTYRKFAVSRLLTLMLKDRKRFIASLRKLMTFDFENIVMAHGEVVYGQGKAKLIEALVQRGLRLDD